MFWFMNLAYVKVHYPSFQVLQNLSLNGWCFIALFIMADALLSLEAQRMWPMDLKLNRSSDRQNFTPMLLVTSNRTRKITYEYVR